MLLALFTTVLAQYQTLETSWRCPQRITGFLLDGTFREQTRSMLSKLLISRDTELTNTLIQDIVRLALCQIDKQVGNASSIRQAYKAHPSPLCGYFTRYDAPHCDPARYG